MSTRAKSAAAEPMRVAYADPPYPGMAHFYPEKTEVDHADLVATLVRDFPDGWALSTASTTLREVLLVCPEKVRIAAWVKPFASWKRGISPAYAWEPVIFYKGRRLPDAHKTRDYVAVAITLRKGLTGAKPEAFAIWLFDLLGLRAGDELVDLFPGTGIIGRTWERWQGGLFTHARR